MANLLSLPNELIVEIVSNISTTTKRTNPPSQAEYQTRDQHSSVYPLYSTLALTCKRFLFVVQPLLYDFITFDSVPGRARNGCWVEDWVDMHSLVRTLCEAPHLRPLIHGFNTPRCLSNDGTGTDGGWPWYHKPMPDEQLIRWTLFSVVGNGELCGWIMHALESRCQAAYMAILMLLAPNARVLTIDWYNEESYYRHGKRIGANCLERIVGLMFRTIQAKRSQGQVMAMEGIGMNRLVTCSLDDVSPVTLASVMSIPTLRTVKATFLDPERMWAEPLPEFTAESSGVTSLELSDAVNEPHWMQTIIGCCRSLKSLMYEVTEPRNPLPNPPMVNPTVIRKVLEKHRDSLETLRIIDSSVSNQVFEISPGALGSLADFSRLAHLEVDEFALFGHHGLNGTHTNAEFFPPNLKTLKYHTYAYAEDLPYFLAGLGVLQQRGLEQLTVSCPVQEEDGGDKFNGLNWEYFRPLQNVQPMLRAGQDLCVELQPGKSTSLYTRMSIRLPNVQKSEYPTFEDSIDMLMRWSGVWGWIGIQARCPQVWEEEVVFGENMMNVFEGKGLFQPAPSWEEDVLFGEALMGYFKGKEVDLEVEADEASLAVSGEASEKEPEW
jgi:hypothetical protein